MISQFEEKITSNLKWKRIEDIPNFPISSFDEIRQKLNSNEFSIGIDFTTSNQFAQWLYGNVHKFFFIALASTPVFIAIASIVL